LTKFKYDANINYDIQIGNMRMKTINATVSKRGQIVLPASIRKEMGIKAGTKILLLREEDKIILQPVSSFTQSLEGLTAQSFGKNPDEISEYIDEERKNR
jgi:AbrB family looped-hinge helix DNA binding protein